MTRGPGPGALAGTRAAPLADWVAPQLATLVTTAPDGDSWLHEIKFDGYRILARLEAGRVRLLSRNRKDWTARFASLAAAIARLPADRAFLDGEVVVLQPDGTTSFQELQGVLSRASDRSLTYFAFDLLHLDKVDLTGVVLEERKRLLQGLLEGSEASGLLRYTDHLRGHGDQFFGQACRHGLEGMISKRADAPYRSGRGRDWLKIKCMQGQEFVIGGYTEGTGSRTGFGALLLGVRDDSGLRYVGRVGTGFSEATLRDLALRLKKLERGQMPFAAVPAPMRKGVHWVEPELVGEVAFLGWTRDGHLRQPSFRGLREDRKAAEVVRERPSAPPPGEPVPRPRHGPRVAGIRISNASKVLYRDVGLTKLDLARYYEMVAPWMLAHVSGRPLTLLRCPDGPEGECFFQKNAEGTPDDVVTRVRIANLKDGRDSTYASIDSGAGLVALSQMGVLEFHVWGSRTWALERPDRVTFDLDPGPGVSWDGVLEGARLLRETLAQLGLESLVMTTGGKGLHVVVPIEPELEWPAVGGFSRSLAQAVVHLEPARYTGHLSKARRDNKIFIDYLRNRRGATAVAPYSTRARPGAPVAVPIAWEELSEGVRADSFTVRSLSERLRTMGDDPWQRSGLATQSLTPILDKARAPSEAPGQRSAARRR